MPTLRPMVPADVDAATEMILGNDWNVRRDWLAFAATQPACVPLVAAADGAIVGTGVGTANGAVGWIGTIFVDPAWRGQGLGRALTQAIIDELGARGCGTLLLVATREGRRLYETMGFRIQTRCRILEAPGLIDASPATTTTVRSFEAADLDAILALDRRATGEDRAHVVRRLATPQTTRVVASATGRLDGFIIRAPWGGGATVATSVEAAVEIVTARRVAAGSGGRVRVGTFAGNAGEATLVALGFEYRWSMPRMIRGEPLDWRPSWIWGQFNHAMG